MKQGRRVSAIVWALLIVLSVVGTASAQVDTAWVRLFDGRWYWNPSEDQARALCVDATGYVYVTGGVGNDFNGDVDYATVKYTPEGDTVWSRFYDGPLSNEYDDPNAIQVDDVGNVYVTGCFGGATIKYTADGDTAWMRRLDDLGLTSACARALWVDGIGNVYVTGEAGGGFDDYIAVKYSSDGDTLWLRDYDGPIGAGDNARDIAVDAFGNVYITGQSEGDGTGADFATIKYASSGDTVWVRRYDGPLSSNEGGWSLGVDDLGNVYVTGSGEGDGTGSDFITIKYNADGDSVWVRRYDGPAGSYDYVKGVKLDAVGNAYVAGNSPGDDTGKDFVIIKYYPDGDTAWVRRYDAAGFDDEMSAFDVDAEGNVYVTGYSVADAFPDLTTVMYNTIGDLVWEHRYWQNVNSVSQALQAGTGGEVCVAGFERHDDPSEDDFLTIKYVPTCDCPYQSDFDEDGFLTALDLSEMIDILFAGHADVQDFLCPVPRADYDCDGFSTAADLAKLIDHLFSGDPGPCDPCNP